MITPRNNCHGDAMPDVIGYRDPARRLREIDALLVHLAGVAVNYRWFLDCCRVRSRVAGQDACPLMVINYHHSPTNPKSFSVIKDLGAACGCRDDVAAAIVHLADNITTSRYYTAELRRKLLRACMLLHKLEIEEPAAIEG